ncbi:hypothetical protein CABS01_14650 [Colletotrichum abscissum]|uniref:Uncharacterized protein n=1 Tax=Colletotrichum costaricense TaxID=1209916 RepID=A0AAI9YJB8_9PEZI|nr:uncharacterized protein CCOS01_14292 [Colletotrichum costaricense]XP_060393105.1 uncharacterized protein CABS01_14650 [Colletotrichum abscissum]KAK1478966.1 hypothetical protein CABS01_14650 [Colletotrichum abscissum]KAK1513350.1 hypothetical protein CCOS01_14292 [Colletotrichum costaricense]
MVRQMTVPPRQSAPRLGIKRNTTRTLVTTSATTIARHCSKTLDRAIAG